MATTERPPRGKRGKGAATASRERASREETTKRILDAAEQLYSVRNPRDVTVREIAEKAGVTHALVHQYIGTKDDLIDAVVNRAAPNRRQMMRELPDYDAVVPVLFRDVLARPVHSRAMVRSAMDGVGYASLDERVQTGRMMIALARDAIAGGEGRVRACSDMDPRVASAAITALAYGWVATHEWLRVVFDLEQMDDDELVEHLAAIASCIGGAIYPAE